MIVAIKRRTGHKVLSPAARLKEDCTFWPLAKNALSDNVSKSSILNMKLAAPSQIIFDFSRLHKVQMED